MNLNTLFAPKSIAVIGASTEVGSVGNDIVRNLVEQNFKGAVYPVNPKASELYGLPCFPSVRAIPASVELAVIAVPANIVPTVLRESGEKGVSAAIVISAGFREAGHADLEEELVRIAQEFDMALLGPNCLGVVAPPVSMNASFAKTLPKRGSVAFLSQSGALGTAILDMAATEGIGVSLFASLGNKALLDESAFLEYIGEDRKTSIVAIYAEDLREPRRLQSAVRSMARAKKPKPLIVLKSGKTEAGKRASSSHTGSIAGRSAAYDALFEESGILEAKESRELFSFARAFQNNSLPERSGIAIVTNAGGPGVLSADAISLRGRTLAALSDATRNSLRSFLPAAAGVLNPIDILGDAKNDRYARALDTVLSDDAVGSVLIILTPQSMTDVEQIAEKIVEAKKHTKKPMVAAFLGGKLVEKGRKILRKGKVTLTDFPEEGIAMLSALERFAEIHQECSEKREVESYAFHALLPESEIQSETAANVFQAVLSTGRKQLSPTETLRIFESYGFPLPKFCEVVTRDEAVSLAREFEKPVAMKILSNDITHKSDVGGVVLNVAPENIPEAFDTMMARVRERVPLANLGGALIMEMAPTGGTELILGSFRDPNLGPVGMVGAGGIYTEILKDASFSLCPIEKSRAEKMLRKLRIFPLLDGARGGEKLDTSAIIEAIGRLSRLLADHPNIDELDINPLLVFPEGKGVMVVDGRISLKSTGIL